MPSRRFNATRSPGLCARIATCLLVGALALSLAATPALAQSAPKEPEKGVPLDQYLREQLTGEDMQRALRSFVESFRPIAEQLDRMMKDVPQYEAPEVLPNGDILIRRKIPGDEIKT